MLQPSMASTTTDGEAPFKGIYNAYAYDVNRLVIKFRKGGNWGRGNDRTVGRTAGVGVPICRTQVTRGGARHRPAAYRILWAVTLMGVEDELGVSWAAGLAAVSVRANTTD